MLLIGFHDRIPSRPPVYVKRPMPLRQTPRAGAGVCPVRTNFVPNPHRSDRRLVVSGAIAQLGDELVQKHWTV